MLPILVGEKSFFSSSQFDLDHESLHESQENTLMIEEKAKPKQYYRFWVLPGRWLRVRYDRLALLALLDRWVQWQARSPVAQPSLTQPSPLYYKKC